jgi:nucleoside-diphosphate-sugar epimerase
VNVSGTKHLLKGLEAEPPKTFVFISSVAVYGKDEGLNITEKHALTGTTPYAQSKIEAEAIVQAWGKMHSVSIVILRLPLISGANPPGNLAAMAKAISAGYYVRIGKGKARKSMVAAADVTTLLPSLLGKTGVYNLCDGLNPTLMEIEDHLAKQVNKSIKSLPYWTLKLAAKIGDMLSFFPLNTVRLAKLTSSLTFSDELARKELNWNPKPALNALQISHAQA